MDPDTNSVQHKIRGHVVFLAVAVLGSGVFVLRGTFGGQSIDDAGVVAAGIAGFAALCHLLLAFCEPRTTALAQAPASLLVILAPLAFLYPVHTCPDQGWPLNPGKGPRCVDAPSSRVVSPGDEVRVKWFDEDFVSVGARWRGSPKVEVLNAAELGCPRTIPATGRDETWGRWMWTKASIEECPPTLRAQFTIPDDAQLAGESLRLRITLPITYPAPVGRVEYVDKKRTFVRENEILLASPAVKHAYWTSWRIGAGLGLAATAIGGLMFVWIAFGLKVSWQAEPSFAQQFSMSAKPC